MPKITDVSVLTIPNFSGAYTYRPEGYVKRRVQKFSRLERLLIAVTAFLGLLFAIFITLLVSVPYGKICDDKICNSKDCIDSSMILLQSVDFSQDPCQNFYKFACGNFALDHPVKENEVYNSWFLEKDRQLNQKISNILNSPVSTKDIEVVKQTKDFYLSCTNKSELNSIGLQPLYDILKLLELPKFIPSNETINNFNLARTLALAQKYLSQDILVSVTIVKEVNNTSTEFDKAVNIFKISPETNSLDIFDLWTPFDKFHSHKKFFGYLKTFKLEKKERRHSSSNSISSKQVLRSTVKFIAAILKKVTNVQNLDDNLIENYNGSSFVSTAYKILSFKSKLIADDDETNDVDEEDENFNSTLMNITERITFSKLQNMSYGQKSNASLSNRIDWKEYITTLLENINRTYDITKEPLLVENIRYFKYLSKTLENTKPEIIQRHIWWKVVEQYAKYTTSDVRAIYLRYYFAVYGEKAVLSRNQICTNLVKNAMNVALSYEMARQKNFTRESEKVLEMLKDIGKAFEALVASISWMDAQTKKVTLDKARAIKKEIGYANWVTESAKIKEYYHGLVLKESDFLMNIVRVTQWEVEKILKTLGKIKTNSSTLFVNPLQVNAYYSHEDNTIFVPAGILQKPFYFKGLESLNYGAIGTILGHELTHGFDTEGKNYNKYGERESLWPENITAEYVKRAKCFVKQYENYTLFENDKINGTQTLAENIADNGGIRESYKAYQIYAARNGEEPKLPGFENFTHEQLLFLSFANVWCESTSAQYYKNSKDSHSPQRVRVLATLQNMDEFSKAYKCYKNDFMNPSQKCIIW